MPDVRITADDVELRLSPAEKIGALHGDVVIPRARLSSVEVLADGLAATQGLRAPGLALPGLIKLGTWRGRSGKRFVAVRRGVPTLRMRLSGAAFDTVLVSTPDAQALADQLSVARRTP